MLRSRTRLALCIVMLLLGGCSTAPGAPVCGNGIIEPPEECDDGNLAAGDGCTPSCITERCGNAILDPGEECDSGESNADQTPDACRTDCRAPRCGDGVADTDEECDAGDANDDRAPNACRTDCRAPRCGDGVIDTGETCDGTVPAATSCLSLGYSRGVIACAADCTLDLETCSLCGDGSCSGQESSHNCPTDCDGPAVVSGGWHSCAIDASGQVRCWGLNDRGQLGDGRFDHDVCTVYRPYEPSVPDCSPWPVTVAGLTDAIDVSAGKGHTCALLSDGEVVCWGANTLGQLGNGTTLDATEPTLVTGVSDAVNIETRRDRTCALLGDGRVTCWGGSASAAQPATLPGVSSALGVSPTAYSLQDCGCCGQCMSVGTPTCVVNSDGSVRCMHDGSLEPVTGVSRAVSVTGRPLVGFIAHAALFSLQVDGSVIGWWGDDLESAWQALPASSALEIATGTMTSAILRPDRTIDASLSGNGDNIVATDALGLSLQEETGCAVLTDGRIVCWGSNGYGQLGDGTYVSSDTAVEVVGL